jgi:hypothetical protein
MERIKRWDEQLWGRFQGMRILAHLRHGTRRGMWVGMWLVGAILLLAGMVLGGVNRQLPGAVIGALAGALLGGLLGGVAGAFIGRFLLPSEMDLSLAIRLADEQECYTPGQMIEGEVAVSSQNMLRTSGGEVYFLCRGIYVHLDEEQSESDDPDFVRTPHLYAVQRICEIPPGMLRPGSAPTYAFQTEIPEDALPTHHGYACSVRWGLYATLDAPAAPHAKTYRELMVESIPPTLERRAYKSSQETDFCQLILTLSEAVCAEKESLEGVLRISPLEDFEAIEVRALLLRIERTHEGPGETVYISAWDPDSGRFQGRIQSGGEGTTYVWLEDEAGLGRDVHFGLADPVTYRFDLDIPSQWRPTFFTKEGQVIWKVGAVVSCEGWPDARVFHEIIVHTGASQQVLLDEEATSPQ